MARQIRRTKIPRNALSTSKWPEKITICGTLELEERLLVGVDYVVSIIDPAMTEPKALRTIPSSNRIILRFHDITEEVNSLVPPQVHHIRRLLSFGRMMNGHSNRHLLVHCFAGVSRSTAAATLLIAQAQPAKHPKEAVKRMLRSAPNAWPNLRMIQIGDAILNYNGALVRAVQSHYSAILEAYPDLGRIFPAHVFHSK